MAKVKTSVMLQNKYFYVRCRLGFTLEGVTTYEIPTQLGFFGFLVEELKTYLGDYVTVTYDEDDTGFQCWTSEVLVTEIQSLSSVGVEEILKDTSSLVDGVNNVGSLVSGIPHFKGVYSGAYIKHQNRNDTFFKSCPSFVNPDTGEGGYVRVAGNYDLSENKIRLPEKFRFNNYDIIHDSGKFAVYYGLAGSSYFDDNKRLLKFYDTKTNKVLVNDSLKNVGFFLKRDMLATYEACNVDIYFKGFSLGCFDSGSFVGGIDHDFNSISKSDYYDAFEFEAHLRDSMNYNLYVPFQPFRFYYLEVDMYTWNA